MAEEGRAVCVYGLPTDVDRERLRDKLLIHFLRERNGGGEVTSVTIIGRTPPRALVTFEESRVVQSVLRHHPHILQLDGIKYELSLGLPCQEPLSLNKVILDMTVTVDCSPLPQGADTLNVLRSEFPGLRMQHGLIQHTCTLQGSYSDFQGAFAHMQMLFYNHLSRAKYPNFSGDNGQGPETREDHASVKKRATLASQSLGLHTGDHSSVGFGQEHYGLQDSNEALTERSTQTQKRKMEEGAECRVDEADLEDLSIIMEADVFAYLQSIKEYKYILRHHGVQVVHVTSEGITTLYLQSEVPTGSEVKQNIRQAHKELRQLYQQQEGCLRKDQVQKSALYMPDGLTVTLKKVQLVLPNVLFSYDQDSIYIVGEKSEVSQAKQMLLLGCEKSIMGSLTEMPPSSPSSASASPESFEREQQVKRKSEVHTPVPPKLIGYSTERKGDVGNTKEYKLAARFKSSGLGLGKEELGGDIRSITAKMDLLMLDLNSKSAPPTKSSHSLSNELTGEGPETFRTASPSYTAEDVLFKNQDPPFMNTFGGTTLSTSKAKPTTTNTAGITSTFTTGVKASGNTSVNVLSASSNEVKTAAPSTTSIPTFKSTLRRTNSFSGRPYLREPVQNNQITVETMINAHAHQRARSNSISSGRPSEDCPITTVEAELTVSSLMWAYIKEAYCNQLDSMKPDLQMSEKQASKSEMIVTLKGTDSLKVGESHRQLQNLVAVVASDFCSQEVRLEELGVIEKDKLFDTCCWNVRSRFRKVTLHTTKSSIFFLGPKLLCSQASDIFRVVFSGQKSHSLSQMKIFQEGVDQGATKESLSIQSTKANHSKADQSVKLCSLQDASQVDQPNSSRKSRCKSTKQKSTTLERLENTSSMMDELSMTNTPTQLANARKDTTGPKTDGPTSLPLESYKKQDTTMTLKQSNLLSHTLCEQCVCGAISTTAKRTTCGVILCCECLPFHLYCRVCGKEGVYTQNKVLDPVQSYGSKDIRQEYQTQDMHSEQEGSKEHKAIQGTMTCAEMPLSLSGYTKYTTAKITYCIPDGIQGDKDPCPGTPFKGGIFEAYLPLDSKGRNLLPYLKKAFNQGLTFTISSSKNAGAGDAKVNWGKIPHKTRMEGGRSRNGYPDSTYLTVLTEALVAHGVEGAAAISQDQAKS
ncbi:uncharacterized protein si:busm1-163l24.3 [Pseudorasbora parva]|uniref:uncharacterized protein si:busm1-163l24.3 n=1 Tax=Pseudorasbora parva TaxID=51549 RepID=UPI00351F30D2